MKLLIVDDHPGVRAMIRQLAAPQQPDVRECASGEAAIELVQTFQPDIVTMDVRLPGLGGLEAARAIATAWPAAQMIIVSAYDQPALRQAALHAGAVEFIPKDNLERLPPVFARFRAANRAPATPAKSNASEAKG